MLWGCITSNVLYHWRNNNFVTYLNLGENSLHPMYRIVGDMMICLRLELSGRDFSVNAMDCGSRMLPPPIWSPWQQKHISFYTFTTCLCSKLVCTPKHFLKLVKLGSIFKYLSFKHKLCFLCMFMILSKCWSDGVAFVAYLCNHLFQTLTTCMYISSV